MLIESWNKQNEKISVQKSETVEKHETAKIFVTTETLRSY